MTIPPSILNRWSAYPGPLRSATAHASIKGALEFGFKSAGISVDVYLQGSYRNYVNTQADSDVDIVAELNSICEHDTTYLSFWETQRFWADMKYVDYSYDRFRTDVVNILKTAFGAAVVEHNKAIEVKGSWSRMKVDVLPALRFRQVYGYDGVNIASHDGIAFWDRGRRVVNWPHQHFDSGVAKNQATRERFKPAVRMFKSARRTAVELGLLPEGSAPSYFLQGLLWNVPDVHFAADPSLTYINAINWLTSNRAGHTWFKCQNGIDQLFGTVPEQWSTASAFQVESALAALWNTWQS